MSCLLSWQCEPTDVHALTSFSRHSRCSARNMSVATPSTVPITNYADFWPHYLREHSKPETRALHYAGTVAGTVMWLVGLCTGTYKLIPAGIFVGEQAEAPFNISHLATPLGLTNTPHAGYLGAWVGHFFVEHNRPATFKYPGWSLVSDYVMLGYWLTGKLNVQLKQAGIQPAEKLA